MAGKSRLGTTTGILECRLHQMLGSPMNPSLGLSRSGSAISALIPQTIVESPIRTRAEPFAVEIEPV
jgi:hypothetical protein